MSSGVPVFTCRVSPVPSAPAPAVTTEPKALNSTLASDRPMAFRHHPGEEDAGGTDQGAGDDQQVVVECEA